MILGAVNFLLRAHLIIAIAGLGMIGLRHLSRNSALRLGADSELKLNYLALLCCMILPFIDFSGGEFRFEPIAKIEAARPSRGFEVSSRETPVVSISSRTLESESAVRFFPVLGATLLLGMLYGFFRLLRESAKLSRLTRGAYPVRRIGRVTVAVSDRVATPFAAWNGRAWVVLPTEMVGDREKFKISILHELQHHRQGDTVGIFFFVFMRSVFVLNPVLSSWARSLSEIQELACDENLVDQGKVKPRDYARCLIEIAETALERKDGFASAAGLAFGHHGLSLSRRIENMFSEKKKKNFALFVGTALTVVLTSVAWAAGRLVVDHHVSMSEAQRLAETTQAQTQFPIEMNARVLRWINYFVGHSQGRAKMRAIFERMDGYKPILDRKISEYGVPEELKAVAIVESGYENLPQAKNKSWGAGLWMFIESTARNFGMRVDNSVDERLDVEKETGAAFRYLGANHLRFQDWKLALMAYNLGEHALQTAIEKNGTRDAWALIDRGVENDRDYLPKVMAAVLIMKNPQLIE